MAQALAAARSETEVLDKSFNPAAIEQAWYQRWESAGYFRHQRSTAEPAYCIQLPPPNVTGTLHMGHAFQQTLMDALIRYHRMRGFNTNWVVGTDHAGIATQIVVERQLEEEGKTRHDLGREKFVERVWQWKQRSGATITRQMRRLGASANWEYADTEGQKAGYFTMDAKMSRAVVEVFVRLYEEGLIYRGKRLVNWDPVLGTAVSDLEVDTEEEDGKIWEIRYPLEDGSGSVTVATTRPETMLGDVAVAVHPERRALRDPWSASACACRSPTGPSRSSPTTTWTGIRHRRAEDHPGPRFQRLPGRQAPRSGADQHLHARRARMNEQAPAQVSRPGPLRRARKVRVEDLKAQDLLAAEKPYKLTRAALGAHQRDHRADAHRPVVREDGKHGARRRWRWSSAAR